MKVIEILNFNKELLNRIRSIGIRLDDCQYIDLYNEYKTLQMQGEKITYIVSVLSDKYSVSERKVYAIIKHFKKDCTIHAV